MVRSFEIEYGCVLKTDLEDNPISVYPIPLQLPLFLFFLPCTFFVPSRPSYLFLVKRNCSSFYFVLSIFPFQGNWSYIPKCRSKERKRALPRSRVKYVNRLTRERKDAFRRGRNAGALDPTDRFPRRRGTEPSRHLQSTRKHHRRRLTCSSSTNVFLLFFLLKTFRKEIPSHTYAGDYVFYTLHAHAHT